MPVGPIRHAIVLLVSCLLVGCQDRDLTSSPKYSGVIGTEYRTKSGLYAVGVFRDIGKKELGFIHISPVHETGPEVAFQRPIPVGSVVKVLAVRKRFVPLENGIEFIVALDGIDLPDGVEIVVPLYGYMQTSDGFPDSTRFERISGLAP